MRELVIREADFGNAAALHDYLARELGFPSYYGANLSALADCLGDVDSPTRIVVVGPANCEEGWRRGFRRVLARVALENPYLDVTLADSCARPDDPPRRRA